MKLYDNVIRAALEELENFAPQIWTYDASQVWPDAGESQLVLGRDAAYELGGSGLPAVHYTCVTQDKGLVGEDQVLLYGPDLGELQADAPYARIALLGVRPLNGDDEAVYRALRDMEFVRYHVFPRGYMFRVSTENFREQVRVSKQARQEGISFRRVGFDFIQKYRENPNILQVKLIFVTRPDGPYQAFQSQARQAAGITRTLTHILDGLPTDCSACQLKCVTSWRGCGSSTSARRKNKKARIPLNWNPCFFQDWAPSTKILFSIRSRRSSRP